MTGSDHPPSETDMGRVILMLEQLRDDQKLMHEAINLRFDTLEAKVDRRFDQVEARLTVLERTVAEHSRKIDALRGMILDNREAIERNRREIEENRREIIAVKELAEKNHAAIATVDRRLAESLEPRIATVEAKVDEMERRLEDLSD